MGDNYIKNQFENKKILISLASRGRDEAQASCSTKTGIKWLNNRLNRKGIWIHTDSSHCIFFKPTFDIFSIKKIEPNCVC